MHSVIHVPHLTLVLMKRLRKVVGGWGQNPKPEDPRFLMDATAWSKHPQRRDCEGPTVRRDQESQAACRQLPSTEEARFPGRAAGC